MTQHWPNITHLGLKLHLCRTNWSFVIWRACAGSMNVTRAPFPSFLCSLERTQGAEGSSTTSPAESSGGCLPSAAPQRLIPAKTFTDSASMTLFLQIVSCQISTIAPNLNFSANRQNYAMYCTITKMFHLTWRVKNNCDFLGFNVIDVRTDWQTNHIAWLGVHTIGIQDDYD